MVDDTDRQAQAHRDRARAKRRHAAGRLQDRRGRDRFGHVARGRVERVREQRPQGGVAGFGQADVRRGVVLGIERRDDADAGGKARIEHMLGRQRITAAGDGTDVDQDAAACLVFGFGQADHLCFRKAGVALQVGLAGGRGHIVGAAIDEAVDGADQFVLDRGLARCALVGLQHERSSARHQGQSDTIRIHHGDVVGGPVFERCHTGAGGNADAVVGHPVAGGQAMRCDADRVAQDITRRECEAGGMKNHRLAQLERVVDGGDPLQRNRVGVGIDIRAVERTVVVVGGRPTGLAQRNHVVRKVTEAGTDGLGLGLGQPEVAGMVEVCNHEIRGAVHQAADTGAAAGGIGDDVLGDQGRVAQEDAVGVVVDVTEARGGYFPQ